MKLTKVLLRWYKSFHLNYRGISDKGERSAYRPWNKLSPQHAPTEEFPFIEIPVEGDITTIVGANESGKSHLLNAIAKVINGVGLDGEVGFDRTDLCHYASVRSRNVEAWPNIGLQFRLGKDDTGRLERLYAIAQHASPPSEPPPTFCLLLAPEADGSEPARLFFEPDDQSIPLDEDQLSEVREILPAVDFIDSKAQLPGEIALARLLSGYAKEGPVVALPNRQAVEEALSLLDNLVPPAPEQPTPAAFVERWQSAKERLTRTMQVAPGPRSLEMRLFGEILQINRPTLQYLYGLSVKDRGYVEGLISKWNEEIDDKLNLEHFWSQDEQFSLSVNYKDGVIYFEIRDKTDSVYTFAERSSGLKYFLSYYIQAKAMEMSHRNANSIILMDEPDSALSIIGQRNLLAVFESLVSAETSGQSCQLIYTTHSPYLINRNFPRRLRVVKKEDAEQGTQYIEQARARRYEPVRTALGVDNAPSLFLGADNVLMEGATDQFLLVELIRAFATPETVGEFIDLNTVEVVSADGAGNIENVLDQSHWADEPIPPTVVLVDGDRAGEVVIKRITLDRKIVDREFARTLAELVPPFGDNLTVATAEDLVPKSLYIRAIRNYCQKWLPKTTSRSGEDACTALSTPDFGAEGLATSAKQFFKGLQPEQGGDFDKMGVLQEVVRLVADSPQCEESTQLRRNVVTICDFLRDALARSRSVTARLATTQAIKRIIHDFDRLNKGNVPLTALLKLFHRLEREVSPIGADGEHILKMLNRYTAELNASRAAGQERVVNEQWTEWQDRIRALKSNPLREPAPRPPSLAPSPSRTPGNKKSGKARASRKKKPIASQ